MSTTSSSIIPIVPIPAAARYRAIGEPSPPAPVIKTLDSQSFSCPLPPTSERIICLLYRLTCSSVKFIRYPHPKLPIVIIRRVGIAHHHTVISVGGAHP